MGFFDGVLGCNKENGGAHRWGQPKQVTSELLPGSTAYKQSCGGCGVSAWGDTPAEAMDRARDFDRANRQGRLG